MSQNTDAPLGAPWAHQQQEALPQVPAPPPNPQEPPKRKRPLRAVLISLGLVVLLVLVGVAVGHYAWGPKAPPAPPVTPVRTQPAFDVASVVAKVSPAVVDIDVELGLEGGGAAGTGIVLSDDGLVLTNNHVVEGATAMHVTDVGNGRGYDATVLGYDRSHDIALIKLKDAAGLVTATLGESGSVRIGDGVVAIGNAGGLGGPPSASPGKVTALGQQVTAADEVTGATETLTGLLQVDADIQSGDSGGPLADTQGHVIGVDTAANAGYVFDKGLRPHEGFAIPITAAADIAKRILEGKASETIHIGPSAFVGLTVVDGGNGTGALIKSVVAGGPAAKLGLKANLLVVGIDDKPVTSATALIALMDTHHPGDKLRVTVAGQGGKTAMVTLVSVSGPIG
ncbi:trypsin-like peptidase domain-containing protein [Amycolatopsis carbonis]|uniref:Trypsin-like peptidase domain-containing protein n=1 Tax=Amycolatopsis carbonis TaxID=715471 RepID=A0A9Y2IM89_9PSEU|nr:trypsin-like peptidase domain-containing protein [Amycolatopsis sp. 2-15]WIX82514.1 trypsin-like peptidase domain-containing protein [Amycolatopsis sp. 2-15]